MAKCEACSPDFSPKSITQKFCGSRRREREHAKHKTAVAPSGEHQAKRFLRQDLRFCKAMVAAGYRWHGES